MEEQLVLPRGIGLYTREVYERTVRDYSHRAHLALALSGELLYCWNGERVNKRTQPLKPQEVPAPLEQLLKTAKVITECSRPWKAASDDDSLETPLDAEATEWEEVTFKVAPYQVSAAELKEMVLNQKHRPGKEGKAYASLSGDLDLVVLAYLGSKIWHQEPMLEHIFGEGWRVLGDCPPDFY